MLIMKIIYNFTIYRIKKYLNEIEKFMDEDETTLLQSILYGLIAAVIVCVDSIIAPIVMMVGFVIDICKRISKKTYKKSIVDLFSTSVLLRKGECIKES